MYSVLLGKFKKKKKKKKKSFEAVLVSKCTKIFLGSEQHHCGGWRPCCGHIIRINVGE